MRKLLYTNLLMALIIIAYFSVGTDEPVIGAGSDSYYVSQSGSDSNPGTENKPWKTIQKAAESAGPGSTVYLGEGTYYERVTVKVSGSSPDKPITFRNDGSGNVVIDGSKTSAEEQGELIRIENQSYVKLIGLELTNNINEDSDSLIAGIGIWGNGTGIEILDCRIHDIGDTATAGGSTTVKAAGSTEAHAIAVYGRDDSKPISGLIIDGNEIWDIRCGSMETVTLSGNIDGFQVTGNYVHDNDNSGIALIGNGLLGKEPVCSVKELNRARNGLVAYNKLERNSRETNPGYPKGDNSAGGISADGAKDVIIAYNTCTENDIGIAVASEPRNGRSEGILVRDNLIFENKNSGIRAGGFGTTGGSAFDCRFLNNTLYRNDTKSLGKGEINIAKSRDLMFHNNIVYTGAKNLTVVTEQDGTVRNENITFNHNLYYGPGGSRGLRFTGVNTGLVGLNMWKQKTRQDGSSLIADPRFTDAAGRDFTLQSRSPAIDLGDPGYVPGDQITDFAGEPRLKGNAVDCGVYEFAQ